MVATRSSYNKKQSKKRKILYIVLAVIALFIFSGVAYGYYLYSSVADTASEMYEELDREKSEKREVPVSTTKNEPISFLILGLDTHSGEQGRSDSMNVMTLNPEDNSLVMMSIPRDTRTEIVGRGFEDKINHAFAFGGVDMTIRTVENFLNIPIDYVVQINMDGFSDMVDAVGGITVDNPFSFDFGGLHFAKGNIELDGEAAVLYSRMRRQDPRGDIGRNERHRMMINALIEKGASFSSITRVQSILDSIGSNVKTNLDFNEMTHIFMNYASVRHNMRTIEIEGSGSTINNIWYLIVSEEERNRVSRELREHLEINN